jgi:hypothetical protein
VLAGQRKLGNVRTRSEAPPHLLSPASASFVGRQGFQEKRGICKGKVALLFAVLFFTGSPLTWLWSAHGHQLPLGCFALNHPNV